MSAASGPSAPPALAIDRAAAGPLRDVHFHVGPDAPWRPGVDHGVTHAAARALADECSIERIVTFPNPQPRADYASRAAADFAEPGPFTPFIRFDPKDVAGALALVDAYLPRGLAGVKLHPVVEFFRPDHDALEPVFARLEERGLVLLIHTSGRDGDPAHAAHLDAVARRHPRLHIVMAHLSWACLPLLERHANLWADTSVSRDGSLEVALARYPERILFGSDFPYSTVGAEVERILAHDPPARVRDLVFRENFGRLFGA